ncbi:phytanoyl-CoA dioxygenase family protein [Microbulbifer sp. ANSA001]|uniref:phytanoyl-CoA dioxygenase family protein n=1 Tax=Microbulbifer sp. ANSA001 TaxID=3243358 RepID=UPI0040410383
MDEVSKNNVIDFDKEINLLRSRECFNETGFLLLRGIITQEKIKKLRSRLEIIFDGSSRLSASIFDFVAEDNFLSLVSNEKINRVLKQLLGKSLRIYPNLTARKATFSPWHVDDAFSGNKVVNNESNSQFIQVSMFLQDNHYKYGGGIDVIPKSHLEETWQIQEQSLSESLEIFRRVRNKSVNIDSVAGDVVIWDGRLLHRSSPKLTEGGVDKYSLMWTVSSIQSNHKEFLTHLENRGKLKESIENRLYDARYQELTHIKRSDFSNFFLEKIKKLDINLTLKDSS